MISAEYVDQLKALHESDKRFGCKGGKHAKYVRRLCELIGSKSVLDYGCGKGGLADSIGFPIQEYDPAIPGKDTPPEPADIVVCTDVLEHVEPGSLDAVLRHLRALTIRHGFFCIATKPSQEVLPDGRNAHLIVQDGRWWQKQIEPLFEIRAASFLDGEARFDVH